MTMNLANMKAWTYSLLFGMLGAAATSSSLVAAAHPAHFARTSAQTSSLTRKPQLLAQGSIYETARKELPEDWYVMYRIVDRIARANQLDQWPWRLVVLPEYDLNAFATENNLIAVYDGLLDQVAGDSAAIACVVGHEMGHHTARHIAVSNIERQQLTAEMEAQARQEIEAELKDAKSDAQGSRIGAGVLDVIGIRIGSGALRNDANKREARAEQRVQEIVTERQVELQAKLLEQNRQNEFEADELGYTYIARAGFDTDGCLRIMQVLGRSLGAEFDSTHPAVSRRVEALQQLKREKPASALKAEGERFVSTSKPLTYELSKDKASLRVNSRRGGSTADDFESQFGK